MKLRLAVVGLGYWGKHYVRLISQQPDCELLAMCDALDAAVQAQKANYPNVATYTNVDEMIAEIGPRLQGVVIAVQASLHYELASKFLDHRIHVLVEKPLTTDVAHAVELQRKAEEHSMVMLVGHTFLFNSAVLKVKSLVDTGVVGKIYNMYATRTNLGPFRKDVNALWDLAPHDVAIFNYLLDSLPDWVSAHASRPLGTELEDVGYIVLGYPNGILAHIHVSWIDPEKVREVCVVGSDARIKFNDLDAGRQVQIYYKSVENVGESTHKPEKSNGIGSDVDAEIISYGEHNLVVRDGDVLIPSFKMTEPLRNQLQYFIKGLKKDIPVESMRSDARFGAGVVRVMAAIDQSVRLQGARVHLQ